MRSLAYRDLRFPRLGAMLVASNGRVVTLATVGQTIYADIPVTGPGNPPGAPNTTPTLRWQRNGVNIPGATGVAYVVQAADIGAGTLSVVGTGTAGEAINLPAISVQAVPVVPVAPANTVSPSISGTAQEGQTLTSARGTWTGTAPITYAYQWQRGAVDISGATASTYTAVFGDVGTTLRVVVTASNAAGSVSANSAATAVVSGAGVGPYALPITPYIRWSAEHSTVTEDAGRIVGIADIAGTSNLEKAAADVGPIALVDGAGQKFWRFPEGEQLTCPTSVITRQDNTFLIVMRTHVTTEKATYFNLGTATLTPLRAVMTAGFNGHAMMVVGGTSVPDGTPAKPRSPDMMLGHQMQLAGVISRPSAGGGVSTCLNGKTHRTLQNTISTGSLTGSVLGGSAVFKADVYEVLVFSRALTDAEYLTVAAAVMANYNIQETENQIVLDGASISAGNNFPGVTGPGMVLSEPGAGLLPAGWRVATYGVGGQQVPNLVARFADEKQFSSYYLTGGQNKIAFEVGVNDISSAGVTGAQHYNNVVAMINTPLTGYLQRGWEVCALGNVGNGGTTEVELQVYRSLIDSPQFLIDTNSGAGGTYEGKVSSIMLNKASVGGVLVFDTANRGPTYYDQDQVHMTVAGNILRVTGGDTPQYSIGHLFA